MDLAAYLQILNRRKWIIILTAITTIATYFIVEQQIPTTYEVTTILRISPYDSNNPSYNALIFTERLLNNYVEIANSSSLQNDLREVLNVAPDQPQKIDVEIVPDSELLLITVRDENPALARDAANKMAELLSNIKIIRDVRISVVDPAILPEPPSILMEIIIIAVAVILGITVGTGLAFIVENLDTRLHTKEEIEEIAGLPILGTIPQIRQTKNIPNFLHNPEFNQGIRSLRTTLIANEVDFPLGTIIITSAYPKEGKTAITSHLAISLALTGREILIIDADMYYPEIHTNFNLENKTGLSDLLKEPTQIMSAIQKTMFKGVSVLVSGSNGAMTTELLGSDSMLSLLKNLSEKFDHILIDTPAFFGLPDTAIIAQFVDATIIVARRGFTKRYPLKATLQQFEQLGLDPLGIVVNHAKSALPIRFQKYYRSMKDYDPTKGLILSNTDDFDAKGSRDNHGQVTLDVEMDEAKPSDTIIGAKESFENNKAKDPLTAIHGIGPKSKNALNAIGIRTLSQLADQDEEKLARKLEGMLNVQKIRCQDWIEQAKAFLNKSKKM